MRDDLYDINMLSFGRERTPKVKPEVDDEKTKTDEMSDEVRSINELMQSLLGDIVDLTGVEMPKRNILEIEEEDPIVQANNEEPLRRRHLPVNDDGDVPLQDDDEPEFRDEL